MSKRYINPVQPQGRLFRGLPTSIASSPTVTLPKPAATSQSPVAPRQMAMMLMVSSVHIMESSSQRLIRHAITIFSAGQTGGSTSQRVVSPGNSVSKALHSIVLETGTGQGGKRSNQSTTHAKSRMHVSSARPINGRRLFAFDGFLKQYRK